MTNSLSLYFLFVFAIANAQQELLYISTRSGNFDIYKLDVESGNSVQLTNNAGWDWSPKYIASQDQIFYYSTDTIKNFRYRLMDLKGERQGCDLPEGDNMVPSPDGRYFSFTDKSGESQFISVYDREAGVTTRAIADSSYNGRVCWKKDGSGFAFISDRDGNNEIYFYAIHGGVLTRLTDDIERQKYLAWSPDGRFLVFSEEINDSSNRLKILEIASGSIRTLTGTEFIESELSWSPDGRYIAFHSTRDQGDQIYMIEIATKKIKQLTSADAYHGEPEWVYR